jgi:N-acetylneuraminate synthase/N,N'-diacetyllegionaminate synthase
VAFAIGGRTIGPEQPPFVIAEAGVNHNGDPRLAIALVDAAADAGADAVKFQTFRTQALTTATAPQAAYQRERAAAASQAEMLQGLELPEAGLEAAFAHSAERGILAFSTPFDVGSVALLSRLGVPALKIGSGDLTNVLLLRAVAATGMPVILSTGMATIHEVDAAVEALEAAGNRSLALLHCVSAYPTPPGEANVRAIPTLRERYGREVGFSDHTTGIAAPLAAVALGATIIEKHLTLDRAMDGPDHAASMEPAELAQLVQLLREARASLGDGRKVPQPSEAETRIVARRSLVAAHELAQGTVLAAADLDAKRPGDGISPLQLDEMIGRRLLRPLAVDQQLDPSDLDPPLREQPLRQA